MLSKSVSNLSRTRNLVSRFHDFKRFQSTAQEITISANAAEFRKEHSITVKGVDVDKYDPMVNFDTTPFSGKIRNLFVKEGFTNPTPIQSQSWPILLDGRDVISVARTGSGKTLGFLLPALHKVEPKRIVVPGKKRGMRQAPTKTRCVPTVLVIAPTRELVMQIHKLSETYSRSLGFSSMCVYGGTSRFKNVEELTGPGTDVLIATPGRCLDLADDGALDLSHVSHLILDEADRMLDMGFQDSLERILEYIPPESDRQTAFFTATWPREVQQLASQYVRNPVQINVGDSGTLNANSAIVQNISIVSDRDKEDQLFDILDTKINQGSDHPSTTPKTIIFMAKKASCDKLEFELRQAGFNAASLHGDKSQKERDMVMEAFRRGRTRVLVATDVAARGLDITDIENVVNYDFPNDVEDYVHRIGRTARGNRTGTAYTFLTRKELGNSKMMKELAGILSRCNQAIPKEIELAGKSNNLGINSRSRYSTSRGKPGFNSGFSNGFDNNFDNFRNDRINKFGNNKFSGSNKSSKFNDRNRESKESRFSGFNKSKYESGETKTWGSFKKDKFSDFDF